MRRLLLGGACGLWLGCGAAEPNASPGRQGGGSGMAGAMASAGATGTAGGGAGGGGAGGAVATGGGSPGEAGTSSAAGQGGSSAGAAGMAGGGAGGGAACVPDPAGAPSVVGDTVVDPQTCLVWMKTTQTGVNYAAAEMFCEEATTGGFDDWRIPTASELASIVTRCGMYPPEGPIDTTLFDLQGDGYWTSTSAGEPNKVCAIGMLNAGGYYHYGTAGPQVVRCVRGSGNAPQVADCTAAQGCMSW